MQLFLVQLGMAELMPVVSTSPRKPCTKRRTFSPSKATIQTTPMQIDVMLVVPSAAYCTPRSSGAPPESLEAARFKGDWALKDGEIVLVEGDILVAAGLERWSSL
jgi:hypothetical protein